MRSTKPNKMKTLAAILQLFGMSVRVDYWVLVDKQGCCETWVGPNCNRADARAELKRRQALMPWAGWCIRKEWVFSGRDEVISELRRERNERIH